MHPDAVLDAVLELVEACAEASAQKVLSSLSSHLVSALNRAHGLMGAKQVAEMVNDPILEAEAVAMAGLSGDDLMEDRRGDPTKRTHSLLWSLMDTRCRFREPLLRDGPTLPLFQAVFVPGAMRTQIRNSAAWEVGVSKYLLGAALEQKARADALAAQAKEHARVADHSSLLLDLPDVSSKATPKAQSSSITTSFTTPAPPAAAAATPATTTTTTTTTTTATTPLRGLSWEPVAPSPSAVSYLQEGSDVFVPARKNKVRIAGGGGGANPLARIRASDALEAGTLSPIANESGDRYVSMEDSPMLDSPVGRRGPLLSYELSGTSSLDLHYLTKAWRFLAGLDLDARKTLVKGASVLLTPFRGKGSLMEVRSMAIVWEDGMFDALIQAHEEKDTALIDLVRSQLVGKATVVASAEQLSRLFKSSAPLGDVVQALNTNPPRGHLPGYGLPVPLSPRMASHCEEDSNSSSVVLVPVHIARRELLRRDLNPSFAEFWTWKPATL